MAVTLADLKFERSSERNSVVGETWSALNLADEGVGIPTQLKGAGWADWVGPQREEWPEGAWRFLLRSCTLLHDLGHRLWSYDEGDTIRWDLYLHPRLSYLDGQVAGTKTAVTHIWLSEPEYWIGSTKWFRREENRKDLEQKALLSVVLGFAAVEKVKSIYVQRYREELQIYVLLSISQYDGGLMDRLLEIEYRVRKRHAEIVFEFFYPPSGISDSGDFIHPRAQCIFAR